VSQTYERGFARSQRFTLIIAVVSGSRFSLCVAFQLAFITVTCALFDLIQGFSSELPWRALSLIGLV